MCSILCWILSIWEALGWKFCIFWLYSCIVNKGEKVELEMACWMHLEGFQVASIHFRALLCTGLTDRGHRSNLLECWSCAHVGHWSDRWWWPVWPVWAEVVAAALFSRGLHAFVQEELHWFRGSLHVCRGALCGFSSFVSVVCAHCLSFVLSRMCRVALA
jgi:hypothetical protein